jgi:NIPSNAP.
MLYELRAYDLKPGKALAYLDLFRRDGVRYVTRHLPMGGYWLADTGALNRVYHLWIYRDLTERAGARAGLAADADWNQRFVPEGFPLILSQRNAILSLVEGSDALDAVVAARRNTHPGQPAEVPIFSPVPLSLTAGPAAIGGELLGHWRALSGEAPGQDIRLFRHPDGDPFTSAPGAGRHEVLSALSLSPLR